jgi:ribosomal protein S27AE
MQSEKNKHLPQWAPRVKKEKIRRLYELDAKGIYDSELLNDVGYALLARCDSFITACRAREGTLPCPQCGTTVNHNHDREANMVCGKCGWSVTWGEYFRHIQHKQLSGEETAIHLFEAFVNGFPKAQNDRRKMFMIDRLLHGFHFWVKQDSIVNTRPVAVNLIDARLGDVINFLDELTFGENSTPGVKENHEDWVDRSEFAKSWGLHKK